MDRAVTRCLVVDDDRLNRNVIIANLRAAGYETVIAEDGVEGLDILSADPDSFDVVILDRSMPRMNGMGLLSRIKDDPRLREIPVIMQTAFSSDLDVADGVKAGVFYYLAKPFNRQLLLSVVAAAVEDHRRQQSLRRDLERHSNALVMMEYGRFCFRTLDEGNALAVSLAQGCPRPQNLVMGFSELFTNAIEHGNLGISYQEKSVLLAEGRWQSEIKTRLEQPEHQNKQVLVTFQRSQDGVRISIRDEGQGFDWRKYMDFDAKRAFSVHGRGIAMARKISFDELIYNDVGNEVTCIIRGKTDCWQQSCATLPPPAVTDDVPDIAPMPPALASSGEEMDLARSMQKELLPRQAAVNWLQKRYPIKISTYFETSDLVGGDLWGIDQLDEHHFTLWLADFSGHGVVAALNTFRLHTMIEHVSTERNRPAAYLAEINQRLVGLLPSGQYATMIYGMLNVQSGVFTYAAAAAPKPLAAGPDGTVSLGDGSGLPLGVSRASRYAERTLVIPPGGTLFMVSDALLEIPAINNKALGWAGVSNLLRDAIINHGPKADVHSILAPFLSVVARPLRDDLTAICCQRP